MRLPLALVISLLCAPDSRAGDTAPAPQLVELERAVSQTLQARQNGSLTSEDFEKLKTGLRVRLDKIMAGLPPAPANTALHARISAQLEDFVSARASLEQALTRYPDNLDLHKANSYVLLQQGDYPGALGSAEKVLKLNEERGQPPDPQALAVKYSSRGRGQAASGVPSKAAAIAEVAPTQAVDHSPLKLAVKSALTSLPTPPVPVGAPSQDQPTSASDVAKAVFLTAAAATGAILLFLGLGANRLEESFPNIRRNMGLAAALGGAVAAAALSWPAAQTAVMAQAPPAVEAARRLKDRVSGSFLQTANSETGALKTGGSSRTKAAAEEATEIVRQVVIKKGEILNRVWHSDWKRGSSEFSGPTGYSYCLGACLPINASKAIEGRGLNIGAINNNARSGGLYRVTDDIVVTVRRSIGGYSEEILLRHPQDAKKLELIRESISSLPP